MLRVGLTGGIGSGKSMVAKLFEKLGIPVYYADVEAKRIMNEDAELRNNILSAFGKDAYTGNILNRRFIASVVFDNKEKLATLNALVHPATIRNGEQWMQIQTTAYAVKEAALIFESGVNKYLDYVIGVSAPGILRLRRVVARDNITPEAVEHRMMNQLDETEKMKRCDFVIVNDESMLVMPQVLQLHEKLLEISAKKNVPI